MKIKFFTPEAQDRNLRATVHKTGKIGFTLEASKKMGLSTEKSALIGMNEEDEDDTNLYVLIKPERDDNAFRINKNSGYYNINAKALFDGLNLDYEKESIIFDISEDLIDNQKVYKLRRRTTTKKKDDSAQGLTADLPF